MAWLAKAMVAKRDDVEDVSEKRASRCDEECTRVRSGLSELAITRSRSQRGHNSVGKLVTQLRNNRGFRKQKVEEVAERAFLRMDRRQRSLQKSQAQCCAEASL